MNEITTKSTKQSENLAIASYKTLGPALHYSGNEIIVMRHGETVVELFPDWIERSNLNEESYEPFDLSIPVELLRRNKMRTCYQDDPPLTEMAKITSKMIARELCERKCVPSEIYCSPDLASVDTAYTIRKFIGDKCGKIRIEPELSTLHNVSHSFFDKSYLHRNGYDIDIDAEPIKPVTTKTTIKDLRARIKRAFYSVTNNSKNPLIIVDPLSAKIISGLFRNITFDNSIEVERKISIKKFSPLSNFTCMRMGNEGVKLYEVSSLSLRPLTYTGFENVLLWE